MSVHDPEKGRPLTAAFSLSTLLRYQAVSAPVPWAMPIMSGVAQAWIQGLRCLKRILAQLL